MTIQRIRHDGPLIVGAGLAGLTAALHAAPRRVLVASAGALLTGASSAWAQGGIAASVAEGDSAALHARDTLAVAHGLGDRQRIEAITGGAREAVDWLSDLGVNFDRDGAGRYRPGLEAAHSRARIVRVGGDGAGLAILRAVLAAARSASHITLREHWRLRELVADDHGAASMAVFDTPGGPLAIEADSVTLATGGLGGLYGVTTNPAALRGEPLAMAWRMGAQLRDLEFVQFHPTAMDIGLDPAPLASEALRGEGARLIDADGQPIMGDHPLGDLAPRDETARTVHLARSRGRGAFLDARHAIGEAFPERFPAVFAACMSRGLDPRTTPIPIAPAAHYHMGGIAVSRSGESSVERLHAIGECASYGMHGANRLASNSLLEAVVCGTITGQRLRDLSPRAGRTVAPGSAYMTQHTALPPADLARLRRAMSEHLGVVRDEVGMSALLDLIDALPPSNAGLTARLMTEQALARRESRGAHFRSDHPDTTACAHHSLSQNPPAVLQAAE